MEQKCKTCKEVKDISEFYKYVRKSGAEARRLSCRSCVYAYVKRWQARNPELTNKRKLESYHRNQPKVRARFKKRYHGDPQFKEKYLAECRRYNHTPQARRIVRARCKRVKDAAFAAYGGYVCGGCGITEPLVLNIDHIGGRKAHGHRRLLRGDQLYYWLKRNNYPAGFRVLCYNCNILAFRRSVAR